jgi:hypothetical protein
MKNIRIFVVLVFAMSGAYTLSHGQGKPGEMTAVQMGASRYIKKQAGEEMVVAITAGASGDINPIYGPGKDFNEIEAVGYHVGKAAWETYNTITTYPVESIDAINTSLTLPGKKECKDHFPQQTYESGPDVEIRLITFRIGHLMPGAEKPLTAQVLQMIQNF